VKVLKWWYYFHQCIICRKSNGTTLSSERYNLPANTVGRFVRITVNGNTQNNCASITEITVNGLKVSFHIQHLLNLTVLVLELHMLDVRFMLPPFIHRLLISQNWEIIQSSSSGVLFVIFDQKGSKSQISN
jgi:hypothetical protein